MPKERSAKILAGFYLATPSGAAHATLTHKIIPMSVSILDLFTIGIGPSSSHCTGPMKAAKRFVDSIESLDDVARIKVELFGSLALTGLGHGTDKAVLLGLRGETPDQVDPNLVDELLAPTFGQGSLPLSDRKSIPFDIERDLVFDFKVTPRLHANAMRFSSYAEDGRELSTENLYSIGGGFIQSESEFGAKPTSEEIEWDFKSGQELLALADEANWNISQIAIAREEAFRDQDLTRQELLQRWQVMQSCVDRGCRTEGTLPGGLKIARRAPALMKRLESEGSKHFQGQLEVLDWVDLFAIAVNEENAAGGQVVTAPTNGAAGIIPAVLCYYRRFCPDSTDNGVIRFLLTAGAIGLLYKRNASISGAEVGCQGEVGVACSMAAAGLTEVLGGSPQQVEQAAEIGMEHNLGLTCDPIAGLVQVPCIERNAMGAVKAINASRLALHGTGKHHVSLDHVICTMRRTGADMQSQYKETSQGGLAVSIPEC